MENAKKEGEPKEADGKQEDEEKAEEGLQQEQDGTEERSQEPTVVDRAELATPPAEDPTKGTSLPSGKMLYNDYALWVAYIVQSYSTCDRVNPLPLEERAAMVARRGRRGVVR